MNRVYFFSLSVSYAACEKLYHAGNNSVVVTADSGERVQLPTVNLRPFINRSGLKGRFRLIINSENKVKSFERIS
ncbi:DUF2835 domain-containing protein [Aestuariibacter sp. AA17]|uniref:DUF2835 domain-containing protein n=1 Tax=Fluctibacter corallii TaxID=2984329 RepID=A0ABT3A697_9ALTE|nr:DUF2835 domain-containing protein [Aestuariibacter sp. AA17]MCV2884143.1 DUF2835 domain-containing protein [Aestuariibacter sp. AA17]